MTIAAVTAFFSAWKASLVEPARAPASESPPPHSPEAAKLGAAELARPAHEAADAPREAPGDPVLVVRLLGPDGMPAAGGRVLLGPAWAPDESRPLDDPAQDHLQEAAPRGGGEHVFEDAAPGRHYLYAIAPGCAGTEDVVDLPREAPLVIRLEEGCLVEGTVRASDGTPIEGAAIPACDRYTGFLPFAARTDAEGRFAMDVTRDGTCNQGGENYVLLEASADGFATSQKHLPPGRESVDFRLFREAVIAGRVIDDQDGRPIPGVEVHAFVGLIPGPPETSPRTDADGRFEVRKVPPGNTEVHVYAEEHLPATLGAFDVEEGARIEGLDVRLRRGFPRHGKVVDAQSGDAIPGATVHLRGGEGLPWRTARTDARGEYELRGLGEGSYRVNASAEGYLEGDSEIDILPGESAEIIVPLERGGTISGRLVDGDGRPVAGASVFPNVLVKRDERDLHELPYVLEWLETSSDPEGSFAVRGLPPRPGYVIQARREGFITAETDPIEARKGHVAHAGDIVLLRGGSVRGRVLDQQGRGVPGAWVAALEARTATPGEEDAVASGKSGAGRDGPAAGPVLLFVDRSGTTVERTDASGAFHLSQLAAGSWAISAGVRGRLDPPDLDVKIAEGETREGIDLVLPGGAVVRGTVLGREGLPVADAEVRVTAGAGDEGPEVSTRTDGSGRFEAGGLPPGRVTIVASPEGFVEERIEAVVPCPEVMLRLFRLPRVAGRIRAPGTARFPLAFVSSWTNEGLGCAEADSSGRFLLIEKPGPCAIEVNVSGFARAWVDLDLSLDERREVEITLGPGGTIEGEVVLAESGEPVERYIEILVDGADGVPLGGPGIHSTMREGRFTLEGIPVGEWLIVAVGDDRPFGKAPVRVRAGETARARIELARGRGIHGAIRRGIRPLAEVKVTARKDGDPAVREAWTGSDGLYEIPDLPSGDYEVCTGPIIDGGEPMAQRVSVEESSFSEADFFVEEKKS